jgi:hypothetical protein
VVKIVEDFHIHVTHCGWGWVPCWSQQGAHMVARAIEKKKLLKKEDKYKKRKTSYCRAKGGFFQL